MKVLTLTCAMTDAKIYFNCDHIVSWRLYAGGEETLIYTTDGASTRVEETPGQILKLVAELTAQTGG